jgi:hypothetical protein
MDLEAELDIRRVAVEELLEDETFVVGLAEHDDGSGDGLLFMIASSFDEQDVALGMDKYCISTSWGATVYGGVESCVLTDSDLAVAFTPEAAAMLDVPPHCLFRLHVEADLVAQLKQGLQRVLSGGQPGSTRLVL